MVEEQGKAIKYEILALVPTEKRLKGMEEQLFEARNVTTGVTRTVAQDEILRRATPIDSSADLFETSANKKKKQ
jgi:hypothetical protein